MTWASWLTAATDSDVLLLVYRRPCLVALCHMQCPHCLCGVPGPSVIFRAGGKRSYPEMRSSLCNTLQPTAGLIVVTTAYVMFVLYIGHLFCSDGVAVASFTPTQLSVSLHITVTLDAGLSRADPPWILLQYSTQNMQHTSPLHKQAFFAIQFSVGLTRWFPIVMDIEFADRLHCTSIYSRLFHAIEAVGREAR